MSTATVSDARSDVFAERLSARGHKLTPAAQRVAAFIDRHRAAALASSAAELAIGTGTSDATVVRTVQALGFSGLPELKQVLAATLEWRASRTTSADDPPRAVEAAGETIAAAIDLAIETHREALESLRADAARKAMTDAVAILRAAERIAVFGIGPSALLARHAALLLARNGRPARTLGATGLALADQLLDLRAGDALVVLAYGSATREVTVTFAEARRLALPLVLITDSLEPKLARQAQVIIEARRGRTDRAALHATTLVVIEALVLGLSAADPDRAMGALHRLVGLRAAIGGTGMRG
jgi:DNA-binding MurR/RpiR family transcriptional regulator